MEADTLRAEARYHWDEQVRHLLEYCRLDREADEAEQRAVDADEARRDLRRARVFFGDEVRECAS
jgi:hypothetical protein